VHKGYRMREVKSSQIKDKIKKLFLKANFCINPDLMQRLGKALKKESSTIGKYVLQRIIENINIELIIISIEAKK